MTKVKPIIHLPNRERTGAGLGSICSLWDLPGPLTHFFDRMYAAKERLAELDAILELGLAELDEQKQTRAAAFQCLRDALDRNDRQTETAMAWLADQAHTVCEAIIRLADRDRVGNEVLNRLRDVLGDIHQQQLALISHAREADSRLMTTVPSLRLIGSHTAKESR